MSASPLDRERAIRDRFFAESARKADSGPAPHLAPIPTEPLEPSERLEPRVSSSVQGRLSGDRDGSLGITRDETALRAKALGITAPLFDSFPCILDGQHTARLHPMRLKDGKVVWQYASRALGRSVGLNELRGIRAYGADRGMTRQEAARWGERLDFEAGPAWPS